MDRSLAVEITVAPIILELVGVRHRFDEVIALEDISLSVRAGEFVTLLGPSGSGKTTLLNIIAGLQTPTSIDALRIGGEDVRDLPAHRRNVTTVFQHYALFPHMSVGENIEYGLRVRGVPAGEKRTRAKKLLELVRLSNMYERRVHQLSGGERQRVALARALAPQPAILLLDEPMGALDEKLRLDMQVELRDLQRRLGTTFVYVTHSQEEALTMSDRIVLMAHGRIVQEGSAHDLFNLPNSRFAAVFMGVENIIEGIIEKAGDGSVMLRTADQRFAGRWGGRQAPTIGQPASAAVRAEKVRIVAQDQSTADGPNRVACKPLRVVYKGKYLDRVMDSPIGPIVARVWNSEGEGLPSTMVCWREDDCVIVPHD